MPDTHAVSAGSSFLRLDQTGAGLLRSVEGGGASADVVSSPSGPNLFAMKHLGTLRYEDFVLRFDLSLDPAVYAWLGATLTGAITAKDGVVLATDQRQVVISQRAFQRAVVSAVTFPALDGASVDRAFLTVRLSPELTRTQSGSGVPITAARPRRGAWLSSSFRLEIDGLECGKVTTIDAFTVRLTTPPDDGETREPGLRPRRPEFPDLGVTLASSSAQTWLDWRESFLIRGKNDATAERNGRLVFLTPDLKDVLGEVRFFGLGLFRLEPEPAAADAGHLRLRAGLYCQRMELTVST
jgi:hypothetical protein